MLKYALADTLHHKEIKNHPERVLNTKMFISKYNWVESNYPTSGNDHTKFGKYNLDMALVVLYIHVNVKTNILIYITLWNIR